ncbi:hypothetical protein NK8_72740 (plasmid) [Caballeronia sp. NK8]|nr:hypothetical protein NK8_72740 [Caballeronia sp. NK8]
MRDSEDSRIHLLLRYFTKGSFMSLILAGRFDTFEKAERARQRLLDTGVTQEDLSIVYVSPQGQHSRTPIGGDSMSDQGAKSAHKGAWKGVAAGALVGGAVGVAIFLGFKTPWVTVFIGIGLGAYIGSLAGAMSHTRKAKQGTVNPMETAEHARHSGVLLAVHVSEESVAGATSVLQAGGAMDIERASGQWQQGAWADFDPTKAPLPV